MKIQFIKWYIVMIFVCVLSNTVYSQYEDQYYDDYFILPHHTPNITFASPDVTELGKYVDVPVSLYTGVPEISIPLYEINTSGLTVPISLSYHSSGIKVQDVASWVGLGWSLNAGGCISRSIKGIRDDMKDNSSVRTECDVPYIAYNAGYLYSGELINNFCNGTVNLTYQQFWELSHGALDGEPDVFNFNFLGRTGKFVFDHQGNIQFFKQNDLDIIYQLNSDNEIESFTIISEDGIEFIFDEIERTHNYKCGGVHYYQDGIRDQVNVLNWTEPRNDITAWKLSEIHLPNSEEIIEFNYIDESVANLVTSREELRYDHVSLAVYNDIFNTLVHNESKRLNEIVWKSGKAVFEANIVREDYDLWSSNGTGANALSKFSVFDNNENLVKQYNFDIDYFNAESNSGYAKRLKLNKVYEVSTNSNKNKEFSFVYNAIELPDRFSSELDYWGYYNSNYSTGNNPYKTLIPCLYEYPTDGGINDLNNDLYLSPFSIFPRSEYSSYIYHSNGDASKPKAVRDPNPAVVEAGILKKIVYPTGGFAEYYYEPNMFYLDGQNIVGGGVRIKKTVLNDGMNNEIVKEYLYHRFDDISISSGKIIYLPQFAKHAYSNTDGYYGSFSTSQGGLGETHGCHVGYENVTVVETLNGRSEFEFSMPGTFGEETALCSNGICLYNRSVSEYPFSPQLGYYNNSNFPYPPDPNIDWARGNLLENRIYDENGYLVKKITNDYSILNTNTNIHALYVKDDQWIKNSWECAPTYEFMMGKYYYISAWQVLDKTTTTNYFNNEQDELSVTVENNFNSVNHKQITDKTITRSDGKIQNISFEYPPDVNPSEVFTDQADINTMIIKNIISPVMKADLFVGGMQIDGMVTSYDLSNTHYLPKASYIYNPVDNSYEKKSNYDVYDNEGNILQQHKENSFPISYYWCLNKQYPAIRAENSTFSELENAVISLQSDFDAFMESLGDLSDPGKRELLYQFIGSLQNLLPDANIYVYTYLPLIGLTSETTPNSLTKIYNYDEFNRLQTIRDSDYNIQKHIEYNIAISTELDYKENYYHGEIGVFNVKTHGGSGNFSYAWEIIHLGNVFASGTGETFSTQMTNNGYFTITCIVTDNESGNTTSITKSFNVYYIPCTFSGINENIISDDGSYIISNCTLTAPYNETITLKAFSQYQYSDIFIRVGNESDVYLSGSITTLEANFDNSTNSCEIKIFAPNTGDNAYIDLTIQSVSNNNTNITSPYTLTLSRPQ